MDTSISLYLELLKICDDIKEYTRNVRGFQSEFSNQFAFSELNADCLNSMYNDRRGVIERKEYFPIINNLEPTCKECWKFYLSPRNKSIKGLDIQLGKKFEEKIREFLNIKGINCKKGDKPLAIFPDNVVVDSKGNIIAYLEIKYQSAPWIWAFKEDGTNRECYEGSPALDIKKLEQQWNLVNEGKIKSPIYYVFWLDFPCIKGIFFIEIKDMYLYYKHEAKIFERKLRDGDIVKRKNGKIKIGHLAKIHPSINQMKKFEELIKILK